jgi:hypothetical protein
MQKNNAIPRTNSKNLHTHPHYFGAFLNIARHNAFMIVSYLSSKYNTIDKDKLEEDKLSGASLFSKLNKSSNKPDETQALIRDLKWYFPFLSYPLFLKLEAKKNDPEVVQDKNLEETNPEQIKQDITQLLILINKLRNSYSHYISKSNYSVAANIPIEQIYRAAAYRLTDRGKYTKRFDVFEPDHTAHLYDKDQVLSDYHPRSLVDQPTHEKTIAFIICLFLERKYAFPFLSRLDGFQNVTNQEPSLSQKASAECFTMFCSRLPQPKLESSDILLDMLNELGRCPGGLYTVLSDASRKHFHVKQETDALLSENEPPTNSSEQQAAINQIDELEEYEQEIALIRGSDRFPYFALRYFDDTDAFPTLRFDLHLGKWRNRPVYTKVIFDEQRDRLLTKPIRAFAKLKPLLKIYEGVNQDDKTKKVVDPKVAPSFHESWLDKTDNQELKLIDSIEQFSPFYNFGDNVIGLKIVKNLEKIIFPKLPKPKNDIADAIISTHDLCALFLYHYLSQKPIKSDSDEKIIAVDAETFIKDLIQRIQKLFDDIKAGKLQPLVSNPDYFKNQTLPFIKGKEEKTFEKRQEFYTKLEQMEQRRNKLEAFLKQEYGLSRAYVPDKIEEYLLGYIVPPYKKRATEKFKQQQALLKNLIKAADKGRSPRIGEQATWLAEDIIFLTPPKIHQVNGEDHPQKLNNDQFRVLQSSLAYFSTNRQKILNFLRDETTILSNDPQKRHPFLFKIDILKCQGIFDFYSAYLREKQRWLDRKVLDKSALSKMSDEKVEQRFGHFLPASVQHKSIEELDYSKFPVYLPRGIFDKAIADALSKLPDFDVQANHKIGRCLDQILNGDRQEFYNWEHFYNSIFIDKDSGTDRLVAETTYSEQLKAKFFELKEQKSQGRKLKLDEKQALKDAYRDVKEAKRRLLDREQYIRTLQTQDRALWLMIQERQKLASEHLDLQLDQLKLKNIEAVLNEPITVRLKILNSEVAISDQLPIKRYGDLRRVSKDRRLENLMLYYQHSGIVEVSHDLIKTELERYDRRREQFFAEVYEFEKGVYEQFAEDFDQNILAKNGYYDHKAYVKNAIKHSSDTPFNVFFNQNVYLLRNKFLHNEFPWFDWLLPEVTRASGELYADRIADIAINYYRKMRKLIQS